MMESRAAKSDIIQQLQREVRSLQGHRRAAEQGLIPGLEPIEAAFADGVFPTGAVHEMISYAPQDAAATNGFISGILGHLMLHDGAALWVSTKRTIFPPALKIFGIAPERIIFVDLYRPKEALWAIEEALKCDALSAVVGELGELSFTESRRLQLAVEKSHVTGFIHRRDPRSENAVACVTRWKIQSIPSELEDGMPGVGFPKWNVELLKVRNGNPGSWQMEWSNGGFQHIPQQSFTISDTQKRKAG